MVSGRLTTIGDSNLCPVLATLTCYLGIGITANKITSLYQLYLDVQKTVKFSKLVFTLILIFGNQTWQQDSLYR